jgi:hypothetical protein
MKVLLFVDGEAKTPLSEDLETRIRALARGGEHIVDTEELAAGDLVNCTGCLLCLGSQAADA